MNVLLVEDDQWLAECYGSWLTKANVTVNWAANAQAALTVLDEVECQVIVVDLFLPGANGIQLLIELASYSDTQDTPVVVCSSALPAEDVNWAAYGVVAALDKTVMTQNQFTQAVLGAV